MLATLPIFQHFSLGLRVFERNFLIILLFVLLIDIPLEVISFFFGPQAYSQLRQNLGGLILAIVSVGISASVLKNITLAGVVNLTAQAKEEAKVDLTTVLTTALVKWWVVVVTSLLASFVVLVLLILGVIPGLIAMGYFAFNIQAVVLENKGFWQAIKYSIDLVKGHWWFVFVRSLLIWIPITALMGLTSFLSYNLITAFKIPTYFIPNALTIMIGYYGWVVFTLFYLNFRDSVHGASSSSELASET